MANELTNKIHYFAVYFSKYDTELDCDFLLQLRKNFFENGKKQKNKVTKEFLGSVYKYFYSLEANHYMKWKKFEDSKLVEKSLVENNKTYKIVTYDSGKIIKASYFNYAHDWLKTEYFCNDYKNPQAIICPKGDSINLTVSAYNENNQKYINGEIVPFVNKASSEELSAICAALNIPSIKCVTNMGSFYYFDKIQIQEVQNTLDKLLKNQELLKNSIKLDDIQKTKNAQNNNEKSFENMLKDTTNKENFLNEITTVEEKQKSDKKLNEKKQKYNEHKFKKSNEDVGVKQLVNNIKINTNSNFSKMADKIIHINEVCDYYYFGEMLSQKRNGRGRTCMPDGKTAYEGNYLNDKRDGFGVYYYKTGKLCYIGNWKENKRNGFGVSFSGNKNAVYIGNWLNDEPCCNMYEINKDEDLIFLNNKKDHFDRKSAISFDYEKKEFFVKKFEDGKKTNKGTLFDIDGNLLYVGQFENGKRNGKGIKYNAAGEIIYKGEFKDDKYNGKGELHLDNGNTIKGDFLNGELLGFGCEYNSNGMKIYEGQFKNNLYSDDGCKFFENGNYLKGKFLNGEPYGILACFDRNKNLRYKGHLKDYKFNGEGILYVNNYKVYEGNFSNNCYSGFGTRYKHGKLEYIGFWEQNKYNGPGILYEDGEIRYVGSFKNGKKHGRINEIINQKICFESIYEDDELIYTREYDKLTGDLVYCGNIKYGEKNGMGALFGEFGEKKWEGIFSNNKPQTPMEVKLKNLEAVKECNELINTEYEKFARGNNFVICYNIKNALYTGFLNNNMPDKRGTLLYEDHKYIGEFDEGVPCGKGTIYKNDGSKLKGVFLKEKTLNSTLLEFSNNINYFVEKTNN